MDALGAASVHGPEGLQAAREVGLRDAAHRCSIQARHGPARRREEMKQKKTPPQAEFGKLMA
jgi:hypothetical protein